MLNISEKRNINFESFFKKARDLGTYINQNLYIKQISKDNNGLFANNDIDVNQLLIKVPKNLMISKNIFNKFVLEQKIEYPNDEFFLDYFSSIPNYEYFKKNSILFIDQEKKNKILNFFVQLSPSRRKIDHIFSSFDELNDYEKYSSLIFKTRAFKYENNKYLCPVIDLVNYRHDTPKVFSNKEGIYCKNESFLRKSDQFFHGYEDQSNIISFFLNYNFLPDNFNRVSIPSNFFTLNIPQNKKDLIDSDYWITSNGKVSNKKRIVFDNLTIPIDFKLEINKIISNNADANKILISILEMLKNEIKYKEVVEFLKNNMDLNYQHFFAKALEINYKKIEELINKIDKNI